MPAKLMPDKATLQKLLEKGLSHQEIVDWIREEKGVTVKRSTVAASIQRNGLAAPRNRYTDLLPWRVRAEHLNHYAPRMLRLLGRRQQGHPLNDREEQRLDSWLDQLAEDGAVVVYVPDTEEGFHYVKGKWDAKGVPIKEKLPNKK